MKQKRLLPFLLACLVLAVLLAGCIGGIPMPKIGGGGRKGPRLAWRDRVFPLPAPGHAAEIAIKSREDIRGTLRLFLERGDDPRPGTLLFQPRLGERFRLPSCWRGILVDAAEIRWPNGESWALFAWDDGAAAWRRTLTLFDPRARTLFSCELEFYRTPDGEPTSEVGVRFTWNPGTPDLRKYRAFLESVKGGYAEAATFGETTRGTRRVRQGLVASVTWRPDGARPRQDLLLRPPADD